jgi:hypothetical protein
VFAKKAKGGLFSKGSFNLDAISKRKVLNHFPEHYVLIKLGNYLTKCSWYSSSILTFSYSSEENNNKFLKFDTSKSMSYQGHKRSCSGQLFGTFLEPK